MNPVTEGDLRGLRGQGHPGHSSWILSAHPGPAVSSTAHEAAIADSRTGRPWWPAVASGAGPGHGSARGHGSCLRRQASAGQARGTRCSDPVRARCPGVPAPALHELPPQRRLPAPGRYPPAPPPRRASRSRRPGRARHAVPYVPPGREPGSRRRSGRTALVAGAAQHGLAGPIRGRDLPFDPGSRQERRSWPARAGGAPGRGSSGALGLEPGQRPRATAAAPRRVRAHHPRLGRGRSRVPAMSLRIIHEVIP